MPLLLVLRRDSWLLLFKDQTSPWLSSSSHVTEKIDCPIFKYCFLHCTYSTMAVGEVKHCLTTLSFFFYPQSLQIVDQRDYLKWSRERPHTCLAVISERKCKVSVQRFHFTEQSICSHLAVSVLVACSKCGELAPSFLFPKFMKLLSFFLFGVEM